MAAITVATKVKNHFKPLPRFLGSYELVVPALSITGIAVVRASELLTVGTTTGLAIIGIPAIARSTSARMSAAV